MAKSFASRLQLTRLLHIIVSRVYIVYIHMPDAYIDVHIHTFTYSTLLPPVPRQAALLTKFPLLSSRFATNNN